MHHILNVVRLQHRLQIVQSLIKGNQSTVITEGHSVM